MSPTPDTAEPLHGSGNALSVRRVAAALTKQAAPAIVGSLMTFGCELINTIAIGYLGSKEQLAAVGLANMMQNVFGLSLAVGFAGAIDTLSSQAHGAGQHRLACVYAQRARVFIIAQLVWILPVLAFCDVWLVAIGQDPEVSRLAAEYNRVSAFFLVFLFQATCLRRLLNAFLRPRAAMYVGFTCVLLHVVWVTLFVGHLKLGNTGLGLANGCTWCLRCTLFSIHWYKAAPELGLQRSWVLGLQRDVFRGMREFLKVAWPNYVQVSGEWWFFELCCLIVGYLGPTPLAAHVATIQFITLPFMIPIGFGAAVSALVGNALGAGDGTRAKLTGRVCIGLIFLVWSTMALVLAAGRYHIAAALTRDGDVQAIIVVLLLIYALQGFFDSSQNVMGSILRGLGYVRLSGTTYLISFYLVMLPVALLLTYPCKIGVAGVWWSMGVGTGFVMVVFGVVISRVDYGALAAEASARMKREGANVSLVEAAPSPAEGSLPP